MKKKANQKKTKLGQGLLQGVREAVAFENKKMNLRTAAMELPNVPPEFTKTEVKAVRERLNVSQPVFAKLLGVSSDTVKAWERGVNKPSGSSARLIQMAEINPEIFKEMMEGLTD